MKLPAAAAKGFTLIEMIVALSIFAVLGVVTGQIVSRVVNNFAVVTERGERLVELQRAMQVIQRDLLQLSNRSIRDPLGDRREALLIQTDGTLEFTRAGWQNPLGRARSSLQRVVYRLEGDVLHRAYFLTLDLTPDTTPQVQQLLTGITSFEVLAIDVSGNEYAFWPVAGAAENPSQALAGLMLRMELEPYGVVERVWAVPDV